MKNITTSLLPLSAFVLFLFGLFCVTSEAHPEVHQALHSDGDDFLESLNREQREAATFPLTHDARTDWSFFPGDRAGISLAEMKPEQRRIMHRLLQNSLSRKGYMKVNHILHIEDVLGRMEGNSHYDSGYYFSAFFGQPDAKAPWAFRFEGHHLSLNYTLKDGEVVSVTPAFFGANPAIVPEGPYAGKETLVREQKLARSLVQSLEKSVRKKAIFKQEAYREIVTDHDESIDLGSPKGVSMSGMTEKNARLLEELIRVYTGNFHRDLANELSRAFLQAGSDQVYFGWAGSIAPGKPHYYRIQAPGMIIEYDNVQDGANHIHSVIRSSKGDFGRDVLADHYKNSSHHEEEN